MEDKPIYKRFWVILLVILIVVLGIAYYYRSAVYTKLYSLDLIPKNESFTELYFDNPTALPTKTIANEKISFSFTIHNVENTAMIYPYVVYFTDASQYKSIFDQGTISLANGDSTSIDVSHIFRKSNDQGEVVVSLLQLNQQIDFLLPDNN